MEYAILLYDDEERFESATPEEMKAVLAAHDQFAEAVSAGGGQVVDGAELRLSRTARSLRWSGDTAAEVVDGPFAETTEQLGGFYVIEAPDLDQVLEWCRLLPHTSEIRPTAPAADPDGAATEAPEPPSEPPPGALQAVALLYGDEEPWAQADDAERQAVYAVHGRFMQAVAEAGGAVLGGRELTHSGNATTLRPGRDGWELTDGPFAETVEQLTGFYVLAARDMASLEHLLHGLPGGITEIRPVAVG